MKKELGLIGLGKMGFNLIQNMKKQNLNPIGYDINLKIRKKVNLLNIETTSTIEELVSRLAKPRKIMLSVPSGEITNQTIEKLLSILETGDIIIDTGNSNYKNSLNNAKKCKEKGVNFVDCGTSGGTYGALNGVCFMVGADVNVIKKISYIFEKLAIANGYLHVGSIGSGHFAKMIHNGIEYGMMQSIGEGFALLKKSQFKYDLNKVARVWNNGSVIRSWLMELSEKIFAKDQDFSEISGYVGMNGEGTWTIMESLEQNTPIPVITLSVQVRQMSKKNNDFSNKVVASLRNEFGNHGVIKNKFFK